jgi:hypothetical protein
MQGNEDGLEKQADEMLTQQPINAEYPAYPDHVLSRRDPIRRGERSIDEVFEASVGALKSVDALLEVSWMEVRSGAALKGVDEICVRALSYHSTGMSDDDVAAALSTDQEVFSGADVAAMLITSANVIQSIPAFGLWTVLAQTFHIPVGRVRSLIMQTRMGDWCDLDR